MNSFDAAWNNQPRIIGVSFLRHTITSVSKTTKSTRKMNSSTLINTYSTILLMKSSKMSANWRTILVSLNSPNYNISEIIKGKTLMLAPKISRALCILWLPMIIEIIGHLWLLCLMSTWLEIIKLTLEAKEVLLGTLMTLSIAQFFKITIIGEHLLNSIKKGNLDLDLKKSPLSYQYRIGPSSH